jgi:hypothetical protein
MLALSPTHSQRQVRLAGCRKALKAAKAVLSDEKAGVAVYARIVSTQGSVDT